MRIATTIACVAILGLAAGALTFCLCLLQAAGL